MNELVLHPHREYSILRRHPWIFSGAVARTNGAPEAGATVRVLAADGAPLGYGAYSPKSQIRARMLTFDPECVVDEGFVAERLARAIGVRASFLAHDNTNAFRLVNAEADGLPGVVVDRYDQWLVCQFSTAWADRWKSVIVESLLRLMPCSGVYERSDMEAREHEGLEAVTGTLAGDTPPAHVEIHEGGCRYLVDIQGGQKSGFYLDQRDNRHLIKEYANGAEVLNAFAYSGGFGVAAVVAGAEAVTHIDISSGALELARENTALNTCYVEHSTFLRGNVFEELRKMRDARREFDLIVLDPPKFADSRSALMKAGRGYKDINLLALKLLRPGGVLATFSCSGAMAPELFHKVVADAAVDAKRDAQVLAHLQQAADHPAGLCFPEGFYLKGLLCRVW